MKAMKQATEIYQANSRSWRLEIIEINEKINGYRKWSSQLQRENPGNSFHKFVDNFCIPQLEKKVSDINSSIAHDEELYRSFCVEYDESNSWIKEIEKTIGKQ
jgi:hypothetical protein